MLLVILGAGASFDSADDGAIDLAKLNEANEWRPPLAKQLFDPRSHFGKVIDTFPDSRSLVVYLRKALNKSDRLLERELDAVSVKAATDPRSATQLMAVRYYLREVLNACSHNWSLLTHGCTNYHYLVERLDQWARDNTQTVLYVTFNYDTLLERAIENAGPKLRFAGLDDYNSHSRLKLFKLHGSVDWAYNVPLPQPFPTGPSRDYVIEHASEVHLPPAFVFRPDQNTGTNDQAWVPALSVPIESKGEFECPPSHVETLDKLLPEADRLLIIGWRATEQHFLKRLAKFLPDPRRVLVASHGKHESVGTWNRINKAKSGLAVRGWHDWENNLGFSDLVASDELEHFLA